MRRELYLIKKKKHTTTFNILPKENVHDCFRPSHDLQA